MSQNSSIITLSPQVNFTQFVFRERENRRTLFIAVLLVIFEFIFFKMLYPFPDFFSDSYWYIYAASANMNISIWPIGYSKFLSAFHWLTHSSTALIAFQYFFLEFSALCFFFSIRYFFWPGKTTSTCLFFFLFCNPLCLYLCNYVNSDPLFAAVSLLWITELLWIIHRPRWRQIFIQAALLFLAFTIRNNAYYYPFISFTAFILSRHNRWQKVSGSIAGVALIIPFILFSRNEAYKLTGSRQFSLFTGWQLANNALYMYDKMPSDRRQWPDSATKELDRLSTVFMNNIAHAAGYRDSLEHYVGNFFIRHPESPLKQYMAKHYVVGESDSSLIIAWGKSSSVFSEFGTRLIQKYPISFARYFMLPNVRNYFFPPLEKLEIYNLGLEEIRPVAQDWFDLRTPDVWCISGDVQDKVLFLFPALFLVMNMLFAGSALWFVRQKTYLRSLPLLNRSLLLNAVFVCANFVFTVVATINVFRYQFIPFIVCITSSLLTMEWLDKKQLRSSVKVNPIKDIKNHKGLAEA